MPTLATLPHTLFHRAAAAPVDGCAPPAEMRVASAEQASDAPDMGWPYRAWEALRPVLLEHVRAASLKIAVEYCSGLLDWAVQSISPWLVDPLSQTPPLGKSLLLAAAEVMPSRAQVCEATLPLLQAPAKTLLAGLLAAVSDGTNPADSAVSENAHAALPVDRPLDFADPWNGLTCIPAEPDFGWQPPDPAFNMLYLESTPPNAIDGVVLVGGWDASSFNPLL